MRKAVEGGVAGKRDSLVILPGLSSLLQVFKYKS